MMNNDWAKIGSNEVPSMSGCKSSIAAIMFTREVRQALSSTTMDFTSGPHQLIRNGRSSTFTALANPKKT